MKTGKLNIVLNFILGIVLLILWGSILIIHGIEGAVAWALAKLFIGPIGVIMLIVCLVILIINLVKKKITIYMIITIILSIFLAFPFLTILNAFQIKYPANINKTEPSITVSWPLKERTIVGWGGNSIEANAPHVIWASERWAYDLVMDPANIDSYDLKDFGIFDKDVVAPIAGTIIAAFDGEKDILPNTEEFLSMEGNHVYIKIDKTGTFLLLNHLKKGSVHVKVGEHVNEGDIIGKVGNSGSTSEPHLHIHHQRQDPTKTILPVFAEGLPLYFKNIDGNPMPEKGVVVMPKSY